MSKLRKVMIVIEETGEATGSGKDKTQPFNVYMAGDIDRLKDTDIKMEDLSSAEFWGSRLFAICSQVLKDTGVIKSTMRKQ